MGGLVTGALQALMLARWTPRTHASLGLAALLAALALALTALGAPLGIGLPPLHGRVVQESARGITWR